MRVSDEQIEHLITLNARGGTIDQDEALRMVLDLRDLRAAARAVCEAWGNAYEAAGKDFFDAIDALRAQLGQGREEGK